MASRRHASFALDAGGLTLTDLGSTNGTLVNGQKVSKASLKIGDIIQIGTTQFRVETAP
jgi:pSer/pThr/pTyr-binding forkhead associated (FHA) protein